MSKNIKKSSNNLEDYKNVFVFIEIQDHERVLDGALELLSKGRELADKLHEKLYAVAFSLNIENYIPSIEQFNPDVIICNEETEDPQTLKHYNSEIFPDLWEELIKKYKPSVILFPATEAGGDLAGRLAARLETGLTAHCSGLDIGNFDDYGKNLLLMKRPAFSGNMNASIICPNNRPQMATVQRGVFKKKPASKLKKPDLIKIKCTHELSKLKIINIETPTRWSKPTIPIEKASIIIAGGRGMNSKKEFKQLYEIAELLGGEVGTTRVPVFEEWCTNERLIGQTGKTVKPDLYIGFGISGQIQHTGQMVKSKRIISVNYDPNAPINDISDYVITEDTKNFVPRFLKRLKEEKKTFSD